jgi:hypothetical protein
MNKKMKKALIAVPLSVSLLIPTFSVAAIAKVKCLLR